MLLHLNANFMGACIYSFQLFFLYKYVVAMISLTESDVVSWPLTSFWPHLRCD